MKAVRKGIRGMTLETRISAPSMSSVSSFEGTTATPSVATATLGGPSFENSPSSSFSSFGTIPDINPSAEVPSAFTNAFRNDAPFELGQNNSLGSEAVGTLFFAGADQSQPDNFSDSVFDQDPVIQQPLDLNKPPKYATNFSNGYTPVGFAEPLVLAPFYEETEKNDLSLFDSKPEDQNIVLETPRPLVGPFDLVQQAEKIASAHQVVLDAKVEPIITLDPQPTPFFAEAIHPEPLLVKNVENMVVPSLKPESPKVIDQVFLAVDKVENPQTAPSILDRLGLIVQDQEDKDLPEVQKKMKALKLQKTLQQAQVVHDSFEQAGIETQSLTESLISVLTGVGFKVERQVLVQVQTEVETEVEMVTVKKEEVGEEDDEQVIAKERKGKKVRKIDRIKLQNRLTKVARAITRVFREKITRGETKIEKGDINIGSTRAEVRSEIVDQLKTKTNLLNNFKLRDGGFEALASDIRNMEGDIRERDINAFLAEGEKKVYEHLPAQLTFEDDKEEIGDDVEAEIFEGEVLSKKVTPPVITTYQRVETRRVQKERQLVAA